MALSSARLQSWHREFNSAVFKGKLRRVTCAVTALDEETLGMFWPDRKRIEIRRDLSEPEARATLLHEMVHQWQHENKRPVDHGESFKEWVSTCLTLTGLRI